MRRNRWLVVALMVLAVLGAWWLLRAPEPEVGAPGSTTGARAPGPTTSSVPGVPSTRFTPSSSAARGAVRITVRSASGPIAGAQVTASLRGGDDPNVEVPVWTRLGQASTDADGLARLELPAGVYEIAASAEGFGKGLARLTRLPTDTETTLTLTLAAGSSLTGRTVEKGSGRPVPLAEVRVLPLRLNSMFPALETGSPEGGRSAASDSSGHFVVDGLAAGWVRVEASAPGHAVAVVSVLAVPTTQELVLALPPAGVIQGFVRDESGQPVAGAEVMAVGREAPITGTTGPGGGFALDVPGGSYAVLARHGAVTASSEGAVSVPGGATRSVDLVLRAGAVIFGTVKSKQGPLAGAVVSLSPYGATGDLGRAISGADGSYRVEGLPPGGYDVVADSEVSGREMKRAITVAAGEQARVDLEVRTVGSVEGRVLDGSGAPVVGATVGVEQFNGSGLGEAPAIARSDASGHYRVDGVGPGRVGVVARMGDGPGQLHPVSIPEGGVATQDLVIEATGIIRGRVEGHRPTDAPVEVIAFRQRRDGPGFRQAVVAADGTFQLDAPAGAWTLRAHTPDEGRMRSGDVTVTVEAGKEVEAVLSLQEDPDTTLACDVQDAQGAPVPGATVSVVGQGMEQTDEVGHAVIPLPRASAAGGALQVHASLGGRMAVLADAAVGHPCLLRLKEAARISGQVTGDPAPPGFRLRAQAEGERWSATQQRVGDRFTLDDVPAGKISLEVEVEDGRTAQRVVEVTEGETASVLLPLHAMLVVTGRVLDSATQAPVPDCRVFIDGRSGSTVQTDATGHFQVRVGSPGEHDLRVWVPGRPFVSRKLTIPEGESFDAGDILVAAAVSPGMVGLSFASDGSARIAEVTPGGPASRAGVLVGDVIQSVDGAPIKDVNDATHRIVGLPGTSVTLGLRRGDGDLNAVVVRAP